MQTLLGRVNTALKSCLPHQRYAYSEYAISSSESLQAVCVAMKDFIRKLSRDKAHRLQFCRSSSEQARNSCTLLMPFNSHECNVLHVEATAASAMTEYGLAPAVLFCSLRSISVQIASSSALAFCSKARSAGTTISPSPLSRQIDQACRFSVASLRPCHRKFIP